MSYKHKEHNWSASVPCVCEVLCTSYKNEEQPIAIFLIVAINICNMHAFGLYCAYILHLRKNEVLCKQQNLSFSLISWVKYAIVIQVVSDL